MKKRPTDMITLCLTEKKMLGFEADHVPILQIETHEILAYNTKRSIKGVDGEKFQIFALLC